MKLNNLDDFTKNNWYITTPASTILDASQLKELAVTNQQQQQQQQPQQQNRFKDIRGENLDLNLELNQSGQQQQIYQHQVSVEEFGLTTIENSSVAAAAASTLSINKILQQQQQQKTKMPATTTATTITKNQQADVLAVEELVHEIKENLRLKARPSTNHNGGGRSSRPSPYHIPCRSWNDQQQNQIISNTTENINNNNNSNNSFINKNSLHHNFYHHHHHNHNHHHHHKKEQDIDDPYELLQTLLKSKNLVKEAVRRLQLNSISPKQRSYFYESDDESRSPMFRMCQLEL